MRPAGATAREWLGLFAHDGRVEDPVGSTARRPRPDRPVLRHVHRAPEITFDSRADFVAGRRWWDLTLNVRMSAAVAMQIPAVLVYRLTDTAEGLKNRFAASPLGTAPMMVQFARQGVPAMSAGLTPRGRCWPTRAPTVRSVRPRAAPARTPGAGQGRRSARRAVRRRRAVDPPDPRSRRQVGRRSRAAGPTVARCSHQQDPGGRPLDHGVADRRPIGAARVLIFDFADDETFRAVRFFA